MSYRKSPLVTGEYYHLFNRGINKMPVFIYKRDYQRFIKSANYYQFAGPKPKFSVYCKGSLQKFNLDNKIIEVISYSLMPNHFHFLVKQIRDGGISEFIRNLLDSYTKYFDLKHNWFGPIFQGVFRSVLIKSDSQLLHISRYIHLNPLISGLVKNTDNYIWSSYPEYLESSQIPAICSKDVILKQFKSIKNYQDFVKDHEEYARELEFIKHQLIDMGD